MPLWRFLRRILGLPVIRVAPLVLDELQNLAEQEQRPKELVVADLLSMALERRRSQAGREGQWGKLSDREQQVAALICLGYTNGEIADRLTIAVSTVSTHVRNILAKYNLHSKAELRDYLVDWDFGQWDLPPSIPPIRRRQRR